MKKPLNNLCLDIKLADPPIPRVFIGVDPAGKDGVGVVTSRPWMPGLDVQRLSRLKRAPVNTDPDLLALTSMTDLGAIERRILGQLVDKQMTSQMLKALTNPYDGVPTERGGGGDLYKTTLRAAVVTKGELDIGDVLTPREFTQMAPEVVEAWIWGPNGEFTALARSQDLDQFLRSRERSEGAVTYNIDRSWRDLDRYRDGGRQVTFRWLVLRRAYRESSAYSPFGYRDHALRDTHVVAFNSYADYALWADYEAEQVYLRREDR